MTRPVARELLAAAVLLAVLAHPRPAAAQVAADVAITKSDDVSLVRVGDTITYTIVVINAGPSAASGVTVTDVFAAVLGDCSTTSVSAGGATGNATGPFSGDITESDLELPAGASITYTSTCTVASIGDGTLSNTASVDATTGDPAPTNNTSTASATIEEEESPLERGGGCAAGAPALPALAVLLPLAWRALRRRRAR